MLYDYFGYYNLAGSYVAPYCCENDTTCHLHCKHSWHTTEKKILV